MTTFRYQQLAPVWRLLAAVLAVTGLTAWSPADPLNAIAIFGDARTETGITYGAGPRRSLDVYAPANAASAPVIVFYYGGNWQGGEKETYRFVASALVARGFVVVIPDYRVYPEVRFDGFMDDAARAAGWVRRNAGRFGGNPNRMFLMGHSAGAHIAAMLTLDASWLSRVGMNPRRDIAGFIGLAGPYDFLPTDDRTLQIIFGGNGARRTQPINFVRGGEPRVLLGTGIADTTVYPRNSFRLAARLQSVGSPVTTRVYPLANHVTLIGSFSPLARIAAPAVDDVADFVRETTGPR